MRIHPKRSSIALFIALVTFVHCRQSASLLLAATTKQHIRPLHHRQRLSLRRPRPPSEPFVSDLYGYSVDSWTGESAKTAWDGTGSPGDGDPTVDSLSGPKSQRAFGFAGPTKATLKRIVAKARRTNAQLRGCPSKPEKTESTTIDGEPAIIDELHCGVFALSATAIHDGHVYVFFTYDQPGKEAAMRAWFRSLVKDVSFGA